MMVVGVCVLARDVEVLLFVTVRDSKRDLGKQQRPVILHITYIICIVRSGFRGCEFALFPWDE
jgi:hypothetical protein